MTVAQVLQQANGGTGPLAAKRVDFTNYQNGQFETVGRYNNLAGGGANEVATTTYTFDGLDRLTGLNPTKGAPSINNCRRQ